MILITAIPLTKRSAKILLQSAPLGVKIEHVKRDLESVFGAMSVHELHVWRLDQKKAIASAHIVVSEPDIASFMKRAQKVMECLHAYGIHSATLQPELAMVDGEGVEDHETSSGTRSTEASSMERCGLPCRVQCEELKCCK